MSRCRKLGPTDLQPSQCEGNAMHETDSRKITVKPKGREVVKHFHRRQNSTASAVKAWIGFNWLRTYLNGVSL
jgi:hypothetical protein